MDEEHNSGPDPMDRVRVESQHNPKEFATDGAFSITPSEQWEDLLFFSKLTWGRSPLQVSVVASRLSGKKSSTISIAFKRAIYKRLKRSWSAGWMAFRSSF